jgi:hypothetical protein
MNPVERVINEMRRLKEFVDCGDVVDPYDLDEWADAIEAAMREPVAEVKSCLTLGVGLDSYCQYDKSALEPGTKLFALPPDAQDEIDLLYQVAQKHPGETRHETTRRLIREAQQQSALATDPTTEEDTIERLREALPLLAEARELMDDKPIFAREWVTYVAALKDWRERYDTLFGTDPATENKA